MKKFVVRDYRISLDEKRFQGCGLVTAVLLSDLHGVWHGEGQKALVKAVKDQNPDLILSAGDLITAGGPCDFRSLPTASCKRLNTDTVGNHVHFSTYQGSTAIGA